jgi:hypothetical protein
VQEQYAAPEQYASAEFSYSSQQAAGVDDTFAGDTHTTAPQSTQDEAGHEQEGEEEERGTGSVHEAFAQLSEDEFRQLMTDGLITVEEVE